MLHDRIKKVRKSTGLTQHNIAKKLDIASSTYQYYERGERQPPADFLVRFITAFEVNPVWLFFGDGGMSGKHGVGDLYSLKEVLIGVEETFQERKVVLSPQKKAELIILLYELLVKEKVSMKGSKRKAFIREHALKFLRLAT